MRTLFVLLMLVSLVNIPARSQPDVPALPDADYAVLTAAVNYLSFCVHPGMAHRRGELLFLRDITQTQKKHGFDFNFAMDQQKLSFLLNPAGTFYTEPEWVAFLSSIDSARITPHRLQRVLTLDCRESQVWSQQQYDVYFGSATSGGHWALTKKYPNYGGIVALSNVAYSADGTKAVCYCSIVSDYKAGSGNLVFLERRNQQWVVVGNAMLWIA